MMITPQESEVLAQKTMQDYVNACKCDSADDVANALMKLVSMCGLGMCAVVGQPETVDRLKGVAAYIAETQSGKSWWCERAN
jgi:hypothetical protein